MTRIRRLRGDARGATIVEFGFVIIPLSIMLLATLDLGYRLYVASALQGALHEAVRAATVGDKTTTQIDDVVKNRMQNIVNTSNLTFERKSYSDFSGVGKPEPLTTDKNGNGSYDTGDCWTDTNGNGSYDTDAGKSGTGGASDIFYYKVTATFTRLVPLAKLLGWSNTQTVSSNTVLRNQPYAAKITPSTVCS